MTCPRLLSEWIWREEEPDPVQRRQELSTPCGLEANHGGRHEW